MIDRRTAVQIVLGVVGLAALPNGSAQAQAGRPGAELVMFDDAGCPYCRAWHREVGAAYRNSAEGRRAPLRQVMLRSGTPADLKLSSSIRATPTFVLVQDGREVGRITGYGGQDFFWSMLGDLMKKLKPGERGA